MSTANDDGVSAAAVVNALAGMDAISTLTMPDNGNSDWEPFPIPFRILFLICFAIWAWGSNVSILAWTGIDAGRLLAVSGEKGLRHVKVYQLAAALSTVSAIGWCAFLITQSDMAISLVYAGFFLLIINPMDGWCRRERFRFLKSICRIFFGGLGTTIYFSDVILADILTSFAKVFADLYATLCHIIVLGGIDLAAPGLVTANACGYHWIGPGLTALPYALRFKQCCIEYIHTDVTADRRRHMANALKYASAFPVIFLSAIQQLRHKSPAESHDDVLANLVNDDILPTVWFAFVLVNSLYSFYWDVAMDWHLGQSGPFTNTYMPIGQLSAITTSNTIATYWPDNSQHAKLLRPILQFGDPFIYYTAIIIDFMLRFTWSLKLSTHLRLDELTAGGLFLNGSK
ncbi:EXS family-domain-containing protein [Syncephalis fuscata]|nr:EXS family-domain-containing protein [Syncephalis fuscata]